MNPTRDEIAHALMMARGSHIAPLDPTPPPCDYRAADMVIGMFAECVCEEPCRYCRCLKETE